MFRHNKDGHDRATYRTVSEIVPVRQPDQEIPRDICYPHYTDERFTRYAGGRTIYLAEGLETAERHGVEVVEGLDYMYGDRIYQTYGAQHAYDALIATEQRRGTVRSAAFYQEWLRQVYGQPNTVLQHIIAGVEPNRGYPYQVFGTTTV